MIQRGATAAAAGDIDINIIITLQYVFTTAAGSAP